nr:hypothetical protein [Mammaliicoccus sp. Marseille-Q6498]
MPKRTIIIVTVILMMIIVMITVIPFKQEQPSTTRVVVDHFNHKYAFPNCYKYEEASNYLDEVTLKDAQDLKYKPINKCTEQQAEPKYKSLLKRLIESTEI